MTSHAIAVTLVTLGGIFLASLLIDMVGRRTRLPRVTLLLLLGVAVGPMGLDLLGEGREVWFPFVADLALVMVAFLLGGELTLDFLREHGNVVLVVSLVVVGVTAAVVAAGLFVLGWPPELALLLGAIATSTAPAAVSDVVREARARGPFARILLGVVAVDDAWGIALISAVLALVLGLQSPEAARIAAFEGFLELVGAVFVGCAVGVPIALLSGRVREGEPTLAEALGGVLLCGGLALWLGVSFLLATMTMGVVVANLARHHRRPFRAIEGIEWPFMVLFFVLSGASLHADGLAATAVLTGAFVALRVGGRFLGGFLGAIWAERRDYASFIGVALLPQAGVAIGMALFVSERVPEVGRVLLSATVAATIVFELFGPILTRWALVRCGATTIDDVSPSGRAHSA